ncbi:MAG: energy transducer TonB [Gammaproteobacteria bacterium]
MSGINIERPICRALLGEEHPRDMLVLLAILVALIHVWILMSMMRNEEPFTEAVPLVMQVSMVSISTPKPAVAPPKPEPPPPPPPEKKAPKPKKNKPVVKKPAPVQQKAPDFAPVEKIEPQPSQQESNVSNTTPSAPTATQTTPAVTETYTEANYKANYLQNPKPEYPSVAKRRGWQGKVYLRVKVSAQGTSDAIAVDRSSGHELLDEAAVEAVKNWRFVPAKRGETPVASSVIVPIVFTLRN